MTGSFEYLGATFTAFSQDDPLGFMNGYPLSQLKPHGYNHKDFYKAANTANAGQYNVFKIAGDDRLLVPCERHFVVCDQSKKRIV